MAWIFNVPPGWPEPPTGWQPGPGWQPDPIWPAAPQGWTFWILASEPGRLPDVDGGRDASEVQPEQSGSTEQAVAEVRSRGLLRQLIARATPVSGGVRSLSEESPTRSSDAVSQSHAFSLPSDGRQSIVGEHYYQSALQRVCRGQTVPTAGEPDCWDRALAETALLVAEMDNRHDATAVRVDICGQMVGHLPREIAAQVHASLLRVQIRNLSSFCEARIVMTGHGEFAVYLHLADPELVNFALNLEPDQISVAGRYSAEVTGEEHHQPDLVRTLGVLADMSAVAVLDRCVVASGKYAGDAAVEVRIEGARVGQLSRVASQRHLPAVAAAAADGKTVVCPASIWRSDTKGLQVTVYLRSRRGLDS